MGAFGGNQKGKGGIVGLTMDQSNWFPGSRLAHYGRDFRPCFFFPSFGCFLLVAFFWLLFSSFLLLASDHRAGACLGRVPRASFSLVRVIGSFLTILVKWAGKGCFV